MKKLKKLKLNVVNHSSLSNDEMDSLVGGGCVCSCSCYWEGQGGSSANTNGNANAATGGYSKQGCKQYCWNGSQTGGNLGGGWSNTGATKA